MVGDLLAMRLSGDDASNGLSDGDSRLCRHCTQPLNGRPKQSRFCSRECCLSAQSAARKAARVDRPQGTLTCRLCGVLFAARYKGRLYCSASCRDKVKRQRAAKRNGTPADRQERDCDVCGVRFETRRFSQLYCGPQCRGFMLNRRRINKKRIGIREEHVSPEQIQKRAAAIRQGWPDGVRRINGTIDDPRRKTPAPSDIL